MADDLGYGELGCYRQKLIKMPNTDSLATGGMKFTQHYSGSPVCTPSCCVLMTGKHTGHIYIRKNQQVQPEGQLPILANTETILKLFDKFKTLCRTRMYLQRSFL